METKASSKYYTILTKRGQTKIANALAYGRQIRFAQFALGDGNGASYDPDENQTVLRREVYRANVANVTVSDETINMMEINMAVPADQGGWIVREMGIFDEDNELIAISKTPDDPKPGPGSGAAKDVVYRLFIIVSNTEAVEIKVDGTVAVATKAEVQAAKEALQKQIDELKALVNRYKHYTAFAQINSTYTNDTPFRDVLAAMTVPSILRTPVTANATDYPADGLLEVAKYAENTAKCLLQTNSTEQYILTITPENAEQIFAGGGY